MDAMVERIKKKHAKKNKSKISSTLLVETLGQWINFEMIWIGFFFRKADEYLNKTHGFMVDILRHQRVIQMHQLKSMWTSNIKPQRFLGWTFSPPNKKQLQGDVWWLCHTKVPAHFGYSHDSHYTCKPPYPPFFSFFSAKKSLSLKFSCLMECIEGFQTYSLAVFRRLPMKICEQAK